MESMKLELILHSAQGLNNIKKMGTMNPYALIWLAGGNTGSDSKFKTDIAKNGGSNPVWDDAFIEFEIEQDTSMQENLILVCEIKHNGTVMDRTIGQVQVPLKHLCSEDASSGEKVSYPVMKPSGEVEGTIVLSYTLKNLAEQSNNTDASSPVLGSESGASSSASLGSSDPLPTEPQQTNKSKNRLVRNVIRVSTLMANSLSIVGSSLTLSGGSGGGGD